MFGCGTTIYTDPDDYRRAIPGATIDVTLAAGESFGARVTWIRMSRLGLVEVDERGARVALVSLAAGPLFISFPLRGDPPPLWNGLRLRRGVLVLHGPADRLRQSAAGSARWGLISVKREDLARHGRALLGHALVLPEATTVMRPQRSLVADLLRLHGKICRLAATKPEVIAHREVARALEQDLFHALVNALAPFRTPAEPASSRRGPQA